MNWFWCLVTLRSAACGTWKWLGELRVDENSVFSVRSWWKISRLAVAQEIWPLIEEFGLCFRLQACILHLISLQALIELFQNFDSQKFAFIFKYWFFKAPLKRHAFLLDSFISQSHSEKGKMKNNFQSAIVQHTIHMCIKSYTSEYFPLIFIFHWWHILKLLDTYSTFFPTGISETYGS